MGDLWGSKILLFCWRSIAIKWLLTPSAGQCAKSERYLLKHPVLKRMSPSNPSLQGSENYARKGERKSVRPSGDGRHQVNSALQTLKDWCPYELTETVALHRSQPDGVPVLGGEVDMRSHPWPPSVDNCLQGKKWIFQSSFSGSASNI